MHITRTHTHSSEWRKEPCFSLECTPPNMLDYTRTGLPRPHRPVNMNSSPSARRVRMEPFLYPNIFLTLRDRGRNQHTHAASSLVMSCRTFRASAVPTRAHQRQKRTCTPSLTPQRTSNLGRISPHTQGRTQRRSTWWWQRGPGPRPRRVVSKTPAFMCSFDRASAKKYRASPRWEQWQGSDGRVRGGLHGFYLPVSF